MGRDRIEDEELPIHAQALAIRSSPNLNHLWARLLIEELRRNHVEEFVISPGSRSTPLALAVADTPDASHYTHYDERGAAFFALGLAHRIGCPVALICTSGSAAANYLPAVVEAAQSAVPLILLTADRPPELIGCGANQAILQDGLYGAYVRWSTTLPCPTTDIPLRFLLAQADEACARAQFPPCGPVHINCPFREPLAPIDDGVDLAPLIAPIAPWLDSNLPHAQTLPAVLESIQVNSVPEDLMALVEASRYPIFVCGANSPLQSRIENTLIHTPLPVPVFVDPLTGFFDPETLQANVCIHGDLLCRSATFRASAEPDLVVVLGGPILSKHMNNWISGLETPVVQITQDQRRFNPSHASWIRMVCDLEDLATWLDEDYSTDDRSEEVTIYAHLDILVESIIAEWVAEQQKLTEIGVAWLVARVQTQPGIIVLGNSMPVRDMATYGIFRGLDAVLAANRGASGIDGNIATAAGLAVDGLLPLTILIGDLALLHDLNSLPLLRYRKKPVVIVVVNNDGGGIFHMLPVAEEADPEHFEALLGTPHGLRFKEIAKGFGLDYRSPSTPKAFADAYAKALKNEKRVTLIEVVTDRKANALQHAELNARILEHLDMVLTSGRKA